MKKKLSTICPVCFATKYLGIDMGEKKWNDYDLVECSCGTVFVLSHMDAIDSGIADTIAILNKKGYKTDYCCEGHAKERPFGYGHAYISFIDVKDREILKEYLLPKTWRDDTEDSYCRFTIRYNKSHCRNRYYLSDIKRWAESLPYKEDKIDYFHYSYTNGALILYNPNTP